MNAQGSSAFLEDDLHSEPLHVQVPQGKVFSGAPTLPNHHNPAHPYHTLFPMILTLGNIIMAEVRANRKILSPLTAYPLRHVVRFAYRFGGISASIRCFLKRFTIFQAIFYVCTGNLMLLIPI